MESPLCGPSRWSRRLAALAMVCGLGVSIILGGCAHQQSPQTTGNAGNGNPGASTTSGGATGGNTGSGSGSAQLQDLQNFSDSINISLNDLNNDASSALTNWGAQGGVVQP